MAKPLLRHISLGGVAAVLLSLAAGWANSQSLNSDDVEKYLESLQAIKPLEDQINTAEADEAANMVEMWLEGNTGAIVQHLESQDYASELEDAVEGAGFKGLDQWVDIAQRVTQAYMAVELDEQDADMASELEQSLAQIRQSPQFTEEQKQALTQQIESTQQQLQKISAVSDADRQAVQPYMQRLRDHFQMENPQE